MLVLSRSLGKRIYLIHKDTGERIEIMPVRIGPEAARIGIHADRDWVILREEVEVRDAAETSRTE